MKRKILLPTDFSEHASRAIRYALELYKDEQCLFYVLNAFYIQVTDIESLIGMEPGSPLFEARKKNSENELHRFLNKFAFGEGGNSNHTFQTITLFSEPTHAIKRIVKEKDIELIVMGTRGQTNAKSKIYGSTAIEVMEQVRDCPVIVVPQQAQNKLPKEIVFPTGFKTPFKRRELLYLIDIATLCQASIKVLHISKDGKLDDKQQSNKDMLDDYFQDVNHTFHMLSHMAIPPAINCFVESRESDMVAFMNRKHSFFASILNQPLAKGIAYNSKVPILVMHE